MRGTASDPEPVRCNDDDGGIDGGGGINCASVRGLGTWFNTRCALFRLGNAGGKSSLSSRSLSVSVIEPSSSDGSGELQVTVGTLSDAIPDESQPRRYDVMKKLIVVN